MTVWNLMPISPFNEDDIRYKSTFKPLMIPASFGREELLRPFHCCINKKKSPISAKKKKKGPCHVCKSIQDIAKFIPRKDFWCLSYDDETANSSSIGSSGRLQLIVSGKNVAQLVRICSSSGVVRELDKKLDEQTIHVYDGDILSLLWYNQQSSSSEADAIKTSPSKLETLVQFRLTKEEDEGDETMNVAAKEESLSDNKVQVSILVSNSQERAAIENNGISNMMSDTKITAVESRDDRDSVKIDHAKDDDDESMQSNTNDLLYTQEDQVKQEAMYEDDNNSMKSGVSIQDSSRKLPVNNVSAAAVPPCIGSVKSSSKDEYESSAPLTLPYEFLASGGESKSYSFDSMDKSPKLAKEKNDPSTPQKSNISGKRRYEDMASTDQDTKVASKTPKKSNVTATDNSSPSTLLSSLTHNEMVKLHEQSAPQPTNTKPSLRHTVLSLTLALTSNASAYDSNFLRDCNVETTPNVDGQRRSDKRQDIKQKWMPRFLQGTKIKIQEKKEED